MRERDQRPDIDCYCPRLDKQILILSDVCFSFSGRGKHRLCAGCVYDREHINAKLLLVLSDILNKKARAKANNNPMEAEQR
jgi:hypothetical protein